MLLTASTLANVSISNTNQVEQDKARQSALAPAQQEYSASGRGSQKYKLAFPLEATCRYINHVEIISADHKLTLGLLGNIARQAEKKCLGIEGIRLLTTTLQNELIARGYITSLIDVPSQSLNDSILSITLSYGYIGNISWASDNSATTSLWNAIPAKTGDILKLTELEQGMANLQRLPGSSAQMKIMPGKNNAESDIQISRHLARNWQVGAWLDDAGSRSSGRYQAGDALYLYDLTTLNDILYLSMGGDVEFNQHNDGNQNKSLYYSIPFGFWSLNLYGSQSEYRQQFNGRYSTIEYKSKNDYASATLTRLLSHTRQQKTTVDARISKSTSHYYFGGSELSVMRKQNPAWDITVHQQRYFTHTIIDASLGVQRSLPWLSSVPTPEEKAGLYSKLSRIIHADLQALMKFELTGDKFSYAPHVNIQISPDILSVDNQFNIGNRWTVRGFDGERTLSGNQGWYWRNDFIWDMPAPEQQLYLGIDVGRITGTEQYGNGKVISGASMGVRGSVIATQYDFFLGTPLVKPNGFHTDPVNLGFSLQWRY
ncbi:TPA: ShlB/FhaC/HecB family hemolysin secretion/activation protein [Klebsiella michiganensis]|nr:ShlB/FhaC/HecB family hemolysin secretion/activation protein [Klebsiella michiganensis]MDM4567976.1 ShlB/FhaC/HecB family hemolysin secretion/activation protein [Klebsiella michiganensis]MDM4584902.1 ShlB/FhaC/HecB family hemolysin secretion/activation protein [Klebsiella michiganensis]